MKTGKHSNPASDGIHGNPNLVRQVAVDQRLGGAVGQDSGQNLELVDLMNLCQIADLISQKLFTTKGLPATTEPVITPQERFWISRDFFL